MDFYRVSLLFRFSNFSFKFLCADKYLMRFTAYKNNRGFASIQHDTHSKSTNSTTSDDNTNNSQWWDHFLSANDTTLFQTLKTDFVVYENFISLEEEKSLLTEIEPYLSRLRYEHNHWDNAIHAYKETERKNWNEFNKNTLNRIKSVAFESTEIPLPYVHVLDIEKVGYIKPHVDSVKFCGRTIAGLSLLSPCVMRLALEKDKTKYGDLLLLPRSLYIMRDRSRFEFTHEVLPEDTSIFKGKRVPRDRRISIIQRLIPKQT